MCQSSYNNYPEKIVDIDLMYPIIIKKTKAKVKAILRDLSSYATLNELKYQKSSFTEASQIFQTTFCIVKSTLPC